MQYFVEINCHCIFISVMKQPFCIQVNEQIVVTAAVLFDCDAVEEKHYPGFQAIGRHLKKVSGIDCGNWDVLKLATDFNIICSHDIGDSDEVNHIVCKLVLICSAFHFM
jgi:nucleolar protein 58